MRGIRSSSSSSPLALLPLENTVAFYFGSPEKATPHNLHAVTAASGIFILKSCFSSPRRLASPSRCAQANKKFHLQPGALCHLRVSASAKCVRAAHCSSFSSPLSSLHTAASPPPHPHSRYIKNTSSSVCATPVSRVSCWLNRVDPRSRPEETPHRHLAEGVWSRGGAEGTVFTAVSD